jgi:hypothetical protein
MGEVDTSHIHSGHYHLFQNLLRVRSRSNRAHQFGFMGGKRHVNFSLTICGSQDLLQVFLSRQLRTAKEALSALAGESVAKLKKIVLLLPSQLPGHRACDGARIVSDASVHSGGAKDFHRNLPRTVAESLMPIPSISYTIGSGWPVQESTLLQSLPSGSIFFRAATAKEMGTWVN